MTLDPRTQAERRWQWNAERELALIVWDWPWYPDYRSSAWPT